MYLIVGADGQELNKGINYKLASSVPNAIVRASAQPHHGATDSSPTETFTHNEMMPLPLPPPLELPQVRT